MSGSGVVDEDTARAIDTGRATAGAMLRTLQKKLQKVFIFFAVGLLGGIVAMRAWIWPTLKRDLLARGADVIAQTPFDVILLQVKLGLIAGILLSIPPLLYFARDPLRERDLLPDTPVARWKLVVLGAMSVALFVGGIVYAYFLFFPIMFSFLANNAMGAGFAPLYSIVHWTQFIMVLGFSFGLAAQLPLAMTAFSYSGIVPYETFRDKWKYAIVIMFGFGALFSPPDPFTQLMWALPLVALYAFSLYLSKVVVTAKRGRASADLAGELRSRWNRIAGVGVLGGAAAYAFFEAGGTALLNQRLLPALPAVVRPASFRPVEVALGLPRGTAVLVASVVAAVVVGLLALLYYVYQVIEAAAGAQAAARGAGAPAAIPLDDLDAAGVRAAPPEAFAGMTEEAALLAAQEAMDEDNPEKARAILDRFDEAEASGDAGDGAGGEATGEADGAAPPVGDSGEEESGNVFSRTGAGMLSAFTEDETTEDDIGGYYYDVAFILDSLRSRVFRIAAVFMLTLAGVFAWLYQGGIGAIRCDFLSRLPAAVVVENCGAAAGGIAAAANGMATNGTVGNGSVANGTLANGTVGNGTLAGAGNGTLNATGQSISMDIVTLHPVEALVFEVKLSTVIAVFAILPFLLYYAWPAMSERGLVTGDRRVIATWSGAALLGVVAGSYLGYSFVAPNIISWLVYDAVDAGMVIAYRVNNFFWLVFLTTVGIGLLADIPITMLLFHRGGLVSYHTMRRRWRVVVIGSFAFGGLVTPDSLYTMFLIAVPVSLAYGIGLALLWVLTLGGRRGRPGTRVEEPAA